jgi:adenylate cyclase
VGALRFEGFTLDTSAGTLMKGGKPLALRPQPMKVLAYLAEHSGELVTNKQLIESCWENPKQTHINSLAQCIKAIRECLGENGQGIVRTVHGRGYVFAAPVSDAPAPQPEAMTPAQMWPPAPAPQVVQPPPAFPEPLSEPSRPQRGWSYALAAAVVAVAVLLAGAWAVWSRATRPAELTMEAVPSIAVLPIKAAADDAERRDADALTNDIETELSRAPRGYSLRIRAVLGHKSSLDDPRGAGRELGVRYLALGWTRREGEARLTNIQLIEAETRRPVWADAFSYEAGEPRALHLAAARIARALGAQVLRAESRLPLPARPEAGHYVILGRSVMVSEQGKEANGNAVTYFDKAYALDPGSVPALLGYGRTRVNQVLNNWAPKDRREALLDEAEVAVRRAAEIDTRDPAVHVLRGAYLRARGKDAQAIAEFQRALELHPEYPLAHAELGRAKIEIGLASETVGHIEDALRLSPTDPYAYIWYYWAGMAEVHAGRYAQAIDWLLKAHGANRGYPNTIGFLAAAYAGAGKPEDARSYMEQHRASFPKFSIAGWRMGLPHRHPVATEQRRRIEALLRQLGAPEAPPDDKAHTGLVQ